MDVFHFSLVKYIFSSFTADWHMLKQTYIDCPLLLTGKTLCPRSLVTFVGLITKHSQCKQRVVKCQNSCTIGWMKTGGLICLNSYSTNAI